MKKATFLRPRACMLTWLPDELLEPIINDERVDAVMAVIDGTAVAVGGVRKGMNSCAEAFLWLTPEGLQYPALFIQMRRIWERYVSDYRRLSMQVDILNPKAIRFAYWLGCVPECVIRNIGPLGEDWLQFVRFNDA